jgi:phosphoribosyl 1,2-cyclic phosphodiesterase
MKLNLCILRSGSHANCTAIWTEDECLLIDCAKMDDVPEELKPLGIKPSMIKAMLLTHAHSDHIDDKALKFALEYEIPLYAHPMTFIRLATKYTRVKCPDSMLHHITSSPFSIGHFLIQSFELDHWADRLPTAGMTLGFTLTIQDKEKKHKIGLASDTKVISPVMRSFLKDSHTLIIEANYSEEFIKTIHPHIGYEEHLGNRATGKAISKIYKESKDENALANVLLAHISDSNNTVELALEEVSKEVSKKHPSIKLHPTFRYKRTEVHKLM